MDSDSDKWWISAGCVGGFIVGLWCIRILMTTFGTPSDAGEWLSVVGTVGTTTFCGGLLATAILKLISWYKYG